MSDIELEFSTPQMCADDRCTGQIDSEGKCSECGSLAEEMDHSDIDQEFGDTSRVDVDIEHRELCPDGGCIGVLGADGSCKECGRVGASVTSDPRLRGLTPSAEDDELSESEEEDSQFSEDEHSDDEDTEFSENEDNSADKEAAADNGLNTDLPPGFANRRLCPDGNCIGVVSDDGRCPECGSVA